MYGLNGNEKVSVSNAMNEKTEEKKSWMERGQSVWHRGQLVKEGNNQRRCVVAKLLSPI